MILIMVIGSIRINWTIFRLELLLFDIFPLDRFRHLIGVRSCYINFSVIIIMSENTPIIEKEDSNILSVAISIFSNHDVSRYQDINSYRVIFIKFLCDKIFNVILSKKNDFNLLFSRMQSTLTFLSSSTNFRSF